MKINDALIYEYSRATDNLGRVLVVAKSDDTDAVINGCLFSFPPSYGRLDTDDYAVWYLFTGSDTDAIERNGSYVLVEKIDPYIAKVIEVKLAGEQFSQAQQQMLMRFNELTNRM